MRVDRFSGNTANGIRDLKRLEDANARLAFVSEEIDTASSMGRHVYRLMLSQAELTLDNITASWATAQERALDRGAFVGKTPYGYQRITDKSHPSVGCLREDPDTGPIVREAYRIAARDGLHAAVTYLREAAPEKRWRTFDARRLLRNRAYLGESHIGSKAKGTLRVKRDAHEPLTTLADWTAAQTEPRHRTDERQLCALGDRAVRRLRRTDDREPSDGQGSRVPADGLLSEEQRPGGLQGPARSAPSFEDHVRGSSLNALADFTIRVRYVPGDLEEARTALEHAESELSKFVTDTGLRDVLGDAWREGAEVRAREVEEARERYQGVASEHGRNEVLPAADELDDPEQFKRALAAMVEEIIVHSGRGAVEDRAEIHWTGV